MAKLGVPGFHIDTLSYTDVRLNVLPVVEAPRQPTTNDKKYPLFTFWRTNKNFSVEGEIWVLTRFESNGDATWVQFSGAMGSGLTGLKDDADLIATADVDNTVKLTGANNITVTRTSTSVLTIGLSGNIPPQQQTEVDVSTGGGVNPVVPDANGLVTVSGAVVAGHGSPIETITRAANAWNIEAQIAIAETVPPNSDNVGFCSFDTAAFTVNSDGWVQLIGGGVPAISFLTDEGSPAVVPNGSGEVEVLGGTGIITSGQGGGNTITISSAASTPLQFDCDVGSAVAALNILEVLGGSDVQTTGAANTITIDFTGSAVTTAITCNDGGTANPIAGIVRVFGQSGILNTTCSGNTVTMNVNNFVNATANNWTPVVQGTTVPGVGTYIKQHGVYMRIGRLILFTFDLQWSAHTGTGNMQVAGFPVVFALGNSHYPYYLHTENISLPANTIQVEFDGENATTFGDILAVRSNASAISVSMDTSGTLACYGFYFSDA